MAKGLFAAAKSYAAAKVDSLLCTNSTSAVQLFVISVSVLFFCLLAARLFPTSPYSIEQYNMRD